MATTTNPRRPRIGSWVEVVGGQHAGTVFQRMAEYDDTYCSGHFCVTWSELLEYAGTEGLRSYRPKSPRKPRIGGWVEVVGGQHAGVVFRREPEYDDAYCSGSFCMTWSELLEYAGTEGLRSYRPGSRTTSE